MRQRPKVRVGVLLLIALLGACDEESPTTPDPLPIGIPNAMALDNLPIVRQLERRDRPQTLLTRVAAFAVNPSGRIAGGSSWSYEFTDLAVERLYFWAVASDGRIDPPDGPTPPYGPPVTNVDIESMLKTNSDRAIAIAMRHGAEEYVKKHQGAVVTVMYQIENGLPVCHMKFWWSGDYCQWQYWVHATSGDFMAKEEPCS